MSIENVAEIEVGAVRNTKDEPPYSVYLRLDKITYVIHPVDAVRMVSNMMVVLADEFTIAPKDVKP